MNELQTLADGLQTLSASGWLENVTSFVRANTTNYKEIAAALAIWLGAIWPAIGIGLIGQWAVQSIWRNPDATSKIQSMAILSIAFAEAVAIYALVISLMILFL